MEQLEARGYEMAEPGWLILLAAIPVLRFVRLHSLTDTPLLQQLVSASVRSAILIALTLGLTRISAVGHESRKAATVMVVDVSESVPDEVLVAVVLSKAVEGHMVLRSGCRPGYMFRPTSGTCSAKCAHSTYKNTKIFIFSTCSS